MTQDPHLDDADIEDTMQFAAERLRVALDCDFTKIVDARSGASGLVVRAGSGWPVLADLGIRSGVSASTRPADDAARDCRHRS